jgi:membrane associated rhomboid family serine protease
MFFTYAFLHGGFVHLVVNMFTLFSLGRTVCLRVGAGGFVALYTAAVVGGAVAFGMLTDPAGPMVGASGGLFGLVGAILAWNTRDLRGAGESLSPVWRALVGLLLLNVVIWWATSGLLAWETHLGGFIAGWLVALVIRPQPDDFTN